MAETTTAANNKAIAFSGKVENEMSELNAAKRKKLPKSDFGLPGSKSYPMPDKEHAANAKARAKQMKKRGLLSNSAYEKIVAKANRKLGAGHHS